MTNALDHYERCIKFCERRMALCARRHDRRHWNVWFHRLTLYHSLRSAAY